MSSDRKRLRASSRTNSLKATVDRAFAVIEAAKAATGNRSALSQLEDIQINTAGYAEPGYADPDPCIIATGNWNKVTRYDETSHKFEDVDLTPTRVGDTFERMGIELEWSDEWSTCDDCGKLVRTSPNGNFWTPSYWMGDGFIACAACVQKDPTDYLASLEGKARSAMTFDVDVEKHGYVHIDREFESGLHHGQDADPKLIAKALKAMGIERFIFKIDAKNPFTVSFSFYVHEEDMPKFSEQQFDEAETDGPSNSLALQKFLVGAGKAADDARAAHAGQPGVVIVQRGEDGEAKGRFVTPQDFAAGKAANKE